MHKTITKNVFTVNAGYSGLLMETYLTSEIVMSLYMKSQNHTNNKRIFMIFEKWNGKALPY